MVPLRERGRGSWALNFQTPYIAPAVVSVPTRPPVRFVDHGVCLGCAIPQAVQSQSGRRSRAAVWNTAREIRRGTSGRVQAGKRQILIGHSRQGQDRGGDPSRCWPDTPRREPPSGPAGRRAKRGRLLKSSAGERINTRRFRRGLVRSRHSIASDQSPPEFTLVGGLTFSRVIRWKRQAHVPRWFGLRS